MKGLRSKQPERSEDADQKGALEQPTLWDTKCPKGDRPPIILLLDSKGLRSPSP